MGTKTLEQLNDYQYKWVALSEPDQEIVGSGNDLFEAEAEAKQGGYTGEITYFKVLPFANYIP